MKLRLGIWMSDPYLYYTSIKNTPVCGHLEFNCLKLKYEVNPDDNLPLAIQYPLELSLQEICCFNNL